MWFSMTFSLTTSPSKTLMARFKMASVAKKASGMLIRLLALSSSVRSNHCTDAVSCGLMAFVKTNLANEQMRSHFIGLRL